VDLVRSLKINITTRKESGLALVIVQVLGGMQMIADVDKAVTPKIADMLRSIGSSGDYSCSYSRCGVRTSLNHQFFVNQPCFHLKRLRNYSVFDFLIASSGIAHERRFS